MSNMPDVNKRILGIQVSREMYHLLQQEAEARHLDLSVFVRMILNEELLRLGSVLTPEREALIKKEIEDAQRKRNNRG